MSACSAAATRETTGCGASTTQRRDGTPINTSNKGRDQ